MYEKINKHLPITKFQEIRQCLDLLSFKGRPGKGKHEIWEHVTDGSSISFSNKTGALDDGIHAEALNIMNLQLRNHYLTIPKKKN